MKTSNILICIVLLLLAFGIIMVYSSSFLTAEASSHANDGFFFLRKQLIWIILSFVLLMIVKEIPYQFWSKIDWIILGIITILLLLVLIPGIGTVHSGARRWFRFGGIGLQPSELAKLALIIFISSFVSKDPSRIKHFKGGFMPLMIICGLVCGLILIEPDLGTTLFLGLVIVLLLIVAGVKILHFVPFFIMGIPVIMYFVVHKFTYVHNRLAVFLNPELYLNSAAGYQVKQSLIGLGSGGLWGCGLGCSKQKLFFLPQQHTDFIFSIVGEELGFLGIMSILLLFVIFLWHARKVIIRIPDLFGSLLALGITLMVMLQALINIGVVTASLPAKGIAFPFISFGGSSLCALMIGIGILLNIVAQAEKSSPST